MDVHVIVSVCMYVHVIVGVCMYVRVIVSVCMYVHVIVGVCMYMSRLPCSAHEFVERYKKSQSLPMLASACPGTVCVSSISVQYIYSIPV